ncbi:MAG TPA: stage III sporulation protein AF [Bacilli bacterium]
MIAWLGEWLRDVVLVILLAAFVDLLLPNSSMQRYVKVVISLFILLTVLTPVVHALFRVDLQKLTVAAFSAQPGMLDSGADFQPLESILAKGEALRKQEEAKAWQMVEQELSARIAKQIEAAFPVEVTAAEATVAEENNEPAITGLRISLIPRTGQTQAQDAETEKSKQSTMRKVEPVRIQIKLDDQARAVAAAAQDGEENRKLGGLRSQLLEFIANEWGIDKAKIDLEIAPLR